MRQGGGNSASAAPTSASIPDANPATVIVLSLAADLDVTRVKASKPRKRNQWRGGGGGKWLG